MTRSTAKTLTAAALAFAALLLPTAVADAGEGLRVTEPVAPTKTIAFTGGLRG
jgi:hypothetical protein